MNCLEARRQMLRNPRRCSEACLEHLAQCQSCTAEHRKLLRLEQAIEDAMQVEPPLGLSEHLQMHGHFLAGRHRRKRRLIAGMAASLLLSAVVLTHYSGVMKPDPMQQLVLAHIRDEPWRLREVHEVGERQMNLMMAGLGGSYHDKGMRVSYAGPCQIRRRQGLHMVVRGQQGPVTVLVMPGEHRQGVLKVKDQRFEGAIYPAGYGSFAVVGEKNEHLSPIASQVRQSISIHPQQTTPPQA